MTSTQVSSDGASEVPGSPLVDMRLEVVLLPVSDVDRAKDFYAGLGWRLDADFPVGDDFRVVQLTPPGSQCSVIFGDGVTTAAPGSVEGLQLAVSDIDAARAALAGRGVDVSEVFHAEPGKGVESGVDPARASYSSYASFADPDGNGWILQEITTRLPGRVATQTTYASAGDLAGALRRAAAAHGEHEARTGKADPDWPDWYAEYMVREAAGEELPA